MNGRLVILVMTVLLLMLNSTNSWAIVNHEDPTLFQVRDGYNLGLKMSHVKSAGNVDLDKKNGKISLLHNENFAADENSPTQFKLRMGVIGMLAHDKFRGNDTRKVHRIGAYSVKNFTKTFGLHLFALREYDKFKGVQSREIVGAGPRVQFANLTNFASWAGIGAMHEKEEILTKVEKSIATNIRIASYLSARIMNDDNSIFMQSTYYYQPLINNQKDVHSLLAASLGVKANGLTISYAFEQEIDSKPPKSIDHKDERFLTSLSVGLNF